MCTICITWKYVTTQQVTVTNDTQSSQALSDNTHTGWSLSGIHFTQYAS